jgi:CHAT domain-containing protein/tetratricopeptide (TPR) repeat protein
MKKIALFFICWISIFYAHCQSDNLSLIKQALIYFDEGNYEDAYNLLSIHSAKLRGDADTQLAYLIISGGALYALNQYKEAEPLLKETVEIFDANQDDFFAANNDGFYLVYYFLSDIYCTLKRGNALDFSLKVRQIFIKSKKEYIGKYAELCLNIANAEVSRQNYDEALKYYEECLDWIKKYGSENLKELEADVIRKEADILKLMQKYDEAEKKYNLALEIFGRIEGYNALETYTTLLNSLFLLYQEVGNTNKAEKYASESINAKKTIYGEASFEYAVSLHNLAVVYYMIEKYQLCIEFEEQAISIVEPQLEDNNDFIDSYLKFMNVISVCYQMTGNLRSYNSCIGKIEKYADNNSVAYANILNSKANTYRFNSPEKAIPLFKQALAIYETHLPKEVILYATICSNLGAVYAELGDYENAEITYLSALELTKDNLFDNPIHRQNLGGLSYVYFCLHNHEKAKIFFHDTKYLYEKNKDTGISYACMLNNYALLLHHLGDNLKAKMYMDIAHNIISMSDSQWASDFGGIASMSSMIAIYCELGYYEEAKLLAHKLLYIIKRKDGLMNDTYALALNNLGVVYMREHNLIHAEKCFAKAVDIFNNKSGSYSSTAQLNLALAYYFQNRKKSVRVMSKLLKKEKNRTIRTFDYLSETERLNYWKWNQRYFIISNSLLYHFQTPDASILSYDNELFAKGLLLKTSNNIRNQILNSGDSELINLYEQYIALNQKIIANTQNADSTIVWERETERMDKILTKGVSGYIPYEEKDMDWVKVQQSLSAHDVAIEFIAFAIINHNANIMESTAFDSTMYCALLIRKDSKAPMFVPLFEQTQLSEFLDDENSETAKRIQKLYSGGNARFYKGQKLYNLIWEPLEKYLDGVKNIYYSPAGLLNRISFAAIPVDTLCLTDKYNLHLVSSTREVIVRKNEKKEAILPLKQVVEYGGILYDIQDTTRLISFAKRYKNSETGMFASRSLPNDSTRSSGWGYLSGTEREVTDIEILLRQSKVPNIKYMGAEANEESFKNLSGHSPELLHIATHGFFLEDEKQIREIGFMQMMGSQKRLYINPLLRSGLLFAGANRAWTNKNVVDGIEDGILTAEEIAYLNLSNTKLVVLSACETGLGEINNSEGVFGLQRSFKLAGVKTLVMTLWKVDDVATSKFMILFYQNLMLGENKLDAFKIAQRAIRNEYKNPYYWAAFVMMD